MDDVTLARFAELAVDFGANIQPGQLVSLSGAPGKERIVRAIAQRAYQKGAKYVDLAWFDPWIKRARIEFAPDDSLEYVPPWLGERILTLGRERGAAITLSGPPAPGLLDDLDPVRAGRDRLPSIRETGEVVGRREINWTILPGPTPAWAQLVHPDLEPADALAKLEDQLLHVLRLDEEDPVAAWRARADRLVAVARTLTERSFDALHYEGPGTDMTVGLLPGTQWQAARFSTADGIDHMPNLPTEEVFTSPDPARVDGHVSASMPLVLVDGTVVRDLTVKFEGGRAVELTSSSSAQETMRTIIARDPGAARLGEVALVDNEGRIGALNTVFYDTLLDENARSHIALGRAFPFLAVDEEAQSRMNESDIHIDFMIGRNELSVTGITADGERVPVLVDGVFRI
jgi:aminopeptidase